MLTALAVLLLSAVGGGIVGALLTSTYPADSICGQCKEKAECQQQILYERAIGEYESRTDKFQEFPNNEEEQSEDLEYQDEYSEDNYEDQEEKDIYDEKQ